MSAGDFALFASYVAFGDGVVGEVARWLATMMRSLRRAAVSMDRLSEFMTPSEKDALVDTSPPYLHCKLNIQPPIKQHSGNRLCELKVSGFGNGRGDSLSEDGSNNLVINRGDVVVITGRVGAGKSLLLETLLGLQSPAEGEISWNGRHIDDRASWFIPPRCGYVSQTPCVFSETLRENILLGYPTDEPVLNKAVRWADPAYGGCPCFCP
jgi:ATP-binding cassette subfamily B protein